MPHLTSRLGYKRTQAIVGSTGLERVGRKLIMLGYRRFRSSVIEEGRWTRTQGTMLVDDMLAPEIRSGQCESFQYDAAVFTARVECLPLRGLPDRKLQKVDLSAAASAVGPPNPAPHVGCCHASLVRPLTGPATVTAQSPAQVGCFSDVHPGVLAKPDPDQVDTRRCRCGREGRHRSRPRNQTPAKPADCPGDGGQVRVGVEDAGEGT
jgi:hypothetical protein